MRSTFVSSRPGRASQKWRNAFFLVADVDEHRLQAGFDVLDAALEDAADDVAVADAFDVVFFEHTVFEQGDAAFELLDVDQEQIALLLLREAEDALYFFNHGKGGLSDRF